ncbi:CNH-domain-containing protein [Rhizopogon salebrosus TDB-379]|nr:CNH-domain-containing protein [Rhizopogon salebrosus TDB-379]
MISVVPNFGGATPSTQMADLKTRCKEAKPLGMIHTESGEIMVIYDTLGCYITKHGAPSRKNGFIHWEAKVTSFAHRGSHALLFSSEFIEIRHLSTGRLDQVIEGSDIRLLLHANMKSNSSDDTLLVAMRGTKDDKDGVSDKIMELVQTSEIGAMRTPMTGTPMEGLWDEWDM